MTFRSAPHLVLPITFKMFRAFKAFFLTYLRWGIKDNFLSKITPRNLVSSTTRIRLLSRKSCGSKWRPLFWQIYIQHLSLRIESHCQLPIAEVYSDKAAADVRLYSCWVICSKSENYRHITSNQHQVLNTGRYC